MGEHERTIAERKLLEGGTTGWERNRCFQRKSGGRMSRRQEWMREKERGVSTTYTFLQCSPLPMVASLPGNTGWEKFGAGK
jgi:hypothetical protein